MLPLIRERVRSGMRNARAKGAKIGRPQTTLDDIPANFLRHYPAYKNGAFNLTELARLCDISRTTAYKYIGLLKQKGLSQKAAPKKEENNGSRPLKKGAAAGLILGCES